MKRGRRDELGEMSMVMSRFLDNPRHESRLLLKCLGCCLGF